MREGSENSEHGTRGGIFSAPRGFRALAAGRMSAGRAMVSLRIEPTGQPTNCRVLRSSGDNMVDSGLCPLLVQRLRFLPALDDHGRPIAYRLDYVATWTL